VACPHFGPCGGCQLLDVPYEAQLAQKREVLRSLLERSLGHAAPAVEPVIGMAAPGGQGPWGFRHKASFVFGPDPRTRRGFVMGHYEAGSRRIVPVRECPVHAPRANRIAFALRDRLARAGISAAGPRLDGILRHIVVRTTHDEREAVAMLVVTRNDKALRAPLRAFLASDERADGLFVSIHSKPGPYMVGEDTLHIDGLTHVREQHTGTAFLVSPTAFFQTNPEAAAVIVRLVLEALSRGRVSGTPGAVLDLYSGSGLFAVPLAAAGHMVTAVEENAEAVRDGQANQRLNRIARERLQFVRARVEAIAADIAARREGRVSAVVLDPPRQGCPQAVLDAVFRRLGPPLAVYVSCNPETLAAELPSILDAGYRIERVQPVDMFPHTEHIETVVTLDARSG
jgi:23S rRNA (uracil1939-C5)-methyltransferase